MSTANQSIYARLLSAVSTSRARRGLLGKHAAEMQPAIYVGCEEWAELVALLGKWGVEWRGSGTNYDPVKIEDERAEFENVKIYRVDAQSHLTAV